MKGLTSLHLGFFLGLIIHLPPIYSCWWRSKTSRCVSYSVSRGAQLRELPQRSCSSCTVPFPLPPHPHLPPVRCHQEKCSPAARGYQLVPKGRPVWKRACHLAPRECKKAPYTALRALRRDASPRKTLRDKPRSSESSFLPPHHLLGLLSRAEEENPSHRTIPAHPTELGLAAEGPEQGESSGLAARDISRGRSTTSRPRDL